jgi:long-subunit acyl-CoA synthetase (AMP-forming)
MLQLYELLSCVTAAPPSCRLAEEFMLNKGGSIGYWQGEIPKVLDDIKALRPSLFCGVPRVFDRIYAGINEQVRSSDTRAACTAERVNKQSPWQVAALHGVQVLALLQRKRHHTCRSKHLCVC